MYGQSVNRLNALPEKLFIEFLNMIGYREPGPMPARGTVCFETQDNSQTPFTVATGTQLFTPDADGENIVYETERTIQVTSAAIEDIYFVDAQNDTIRKLDLSERPRSFFEPSGEELQRHMFMAAENDVLRLDCPAAHPPESRTGAGDLADACGQEPSMDIPAQREGDPL